MPLYIDIHELHSATAEDVAAHIADMATQGKYGVNYIKYWVNEDCGKVFCLVDAPTPEAAGQVHKGAHGLELGRSTPQGLRAAGPGRVSPYYWTAGPVRQILAAVSGANQGVPGKCSS